MFFDPSIIFSLIGFVFAGYAVIANDSVQTLGTFIASNKKIKWWYLWMFASSILITTIFISWVLYDGDISYGRLDKIPEVSLQWYHVLAPLSLVFLTRFGIPVSSSLLILASFSSILVFEKIIVKSLLGYILAACVAFLLWIGISYIFPKIENYFTRNELFWRVLQWFATGFLWYTWLSHDIANTAIFLPRSLSLWEVIVVIVFFVFALAFIFKNQGGKIQEIVLNKTNTTYIKSATMIDLVYAFLLLYFKELNNIPMSTTWVFIGLLAGREIGIFIMNKNNSQKNIFALLRKDALKISGGFIISIIVVLIIQS